MNAVQSSQDFQKTPPFALKQKARDDHQPQSHYYSNKDVTQSIDDYGAKNDSSYYKTSQNFSLNNPTLNS